MENIFNSTNILSFLREILQYRVLIITPIFACFIILLIIQLIKTIKQANKETMEKYDAKIKEKGKLQGLQKKMSQKGIMYRMDNFNLMPSSYVTVRCMIGLTTGVIIFSLIQVISLRIALILAIVFGVLGYLLTDIIFNLLNKSDNDKMLMDIYSSYVALKNQVESGKYIDDIIKYIYDNVKFDRYKQALMELIINIEDKTMTNERAIEIFQNRFDNSNIKKFCSVLNSFSIYGINDKFINNLTKEIEAIITANTMKEEENIKRQTGMISFAMFTTIIVAILYCIIIGFDKINFF